MSGRADISAGKAFVELYVKSGSLAHGLADARRRLHDFGNSAALVGAALAASGTAILAPIGAAIQQFAAMGSELNDMAQRTGVAAGALAELKFAAEQSGASLSDVEVAIRNIQRTVTDAAGGSESAKKALAGLGLTAGQLKGKLPDQQLQMIADRLAGIQDPAKRTAAAIDILGKSGAQLLPMVSELAALRAEARRLGIVPTDKAIKEAAAIGNLFGKIKSVALAAVFEIGSAVGPILMPVLEMVKDIGASFVIWVRQNGEIVRTAAKIGAAMVAAGAAVSGIGVAFMLAARGIGLLQMGLSLFTPFIAPVKIAAVALQTLRGVTRTLGTVVSQTFTGMATVIGQAAVQASSMVSSVASAGWRMAGSVASAAVQAGRALFTAISGQIARLAAQAPAAFNRIASAARAAFAAATNAAAGFGKEASHWINRPWQYFRAFAPQVASDANKLLARIMAQIRDRASDAANRLAQAWQASTARVSAAVGQAATYIANRMSAIGGPVAARVIQAWSSMAGAVSSRVSQTWGLIAADVSRLAARIKTFLGPVLPMLQADFGRIASYAKAGFSTMLVVARGAASGLVAAFRFAGPAIARGLTTSISGALSRIGAMGYAAGGMLARGIGGGMRGMGGLLSGGAGLISMLGVGAGGMLGQFAGIVPQLLMIGSSMSMLLSPATLLIGAIAGGVYLWGKYSASGRAAMASLAATFSPFVQIAKQTFGGVYDAIKAGDLALAGQVAMAGLKLSFVTGMVALGDAVGGTWGAAISDIGAKMAGGDFAGAWATAVQGMAAVWDAWSEGVVKTFTGAISAVVDAWKTGVNAISDFLLEASASGGAMGTIASGILGVNMKDEKERSGLLDENNRTVAIRNQQRITAEHEKMLIAARAAGNAADIAKFEKAIEVGKAKLAELNGGKAGPDFMDEAKQNARDQVAGTADAINEVLREMDRDAEAKTQQSSDELANSLPKEKSDAVAKAQAELDELTKKASEKKREADQKKDEDQKKINFDAADGAGGALTEAKNVAGTFSAAAAVALGNTARPELQVAKEGVVWQRESKKAIDESRKVLEEIKKNTAKTTARAGK